MRNDKLVEVWSFDSGNDKNKAGYGDGNHNCMPADVDNDGKQELVLGGCCIDDNGTVIDNMPAPANNFLIYWDGDLEREILDGVDISKMTSATRISNIFSADGCSANNASKNVPCLSADIFGDWREELFVRTADNSALFFTVYNRYCRLLLSKYGCLGGVSICLHYRSNYK